MAELVALELDLVDRGLGDPIADELTHYQARELADILSGPGIVGGRVLSADLMRTHQREAHGQRSPRLDG